MSFFCGQTVWVFYEGDGVEEAVFDRPAEPGPCHGLVFVVNQQHYEAVEPQHVFGCREDALNFAG